MEVDVGWVDRSERQLQLFTFRRVRGYPGINYRGVQRTI